MKRDPEPPPPATPPYRIRAARPADRGPLTAVLGTAFEATYRGLMPAAVVDALSRPEAPGTWEARIHPRNPQERLFVLEDERGLPVGFCQTGPPRHDAEPGTAELFRLYLTPTAQGRGLGRVLLAHALGDLERRGFRRVTLWCLETNLRARSFYRAAGFRETGPAVEHVVLGHALPHLELLREPG